MIVLEISRGLKFLPQSHLDVGGYKLLQRKSSLKMLNIVSKF